MIFSEIKMAEGFDFDGRNAWGSVGKVLSQPEIHNNDEEEEESEEEEEESEEEEDDARNPFVMAEKAHNEYVKALATQTELEKIASSKERKRRRKLAKAKMKEKLLAKAKRRRQRERDELENAYTSDLSLTQTDDPDNELYAQPESTDNAYVMSGGGHSIFSDLNDDAPSVVPIKIRKGLYI